MKQLYLLLFTLFAISLSGCLEEPDMDPTLQNAFAPELEKFTPANVNITATTIVARATVKKENGDPVTERGFIYWLKNTDKVETKKETNVENGKGEFKQEIGGLKNDTVYCISPFARNKKGITYGDTLDINTKKGIGNVITSEVTGITATSAIVGGTIRDKGEGEIKMIGFNLYKNSELDSVIKIDMDEMPTDSTFIHTLTELEPETDYVIEAVVKNDFGQFNTNKQSFKTPDGHPELGLLSVIETDYTAVTVRAKLIEKGDGELDSIGFCWSEVKDINRPNIEQDSTIKCTVEEDGFFKGLIPNLKAQTQYFVHAYAVNAFGTVYTSESIAVSVKSDAPTIFMDDATNYKMEAGTVTVTGVLQSDGRSDVTEIIICCSSSDIPKPGENEREIRLTKENLDAEGKFEVSFDKLKGGKTYKVIAYATNSYKPEVPGNTVSFTTPNIFSNLKMFEEKGRIQFAAFSLDNMAFVLGGDMGSARTGELQGYDAEQGKWIPLANYPQAASNISVCTSGNTAYTFGGKSSSIGLAHIKDCYSYSFEENNWNQLSELTGDNLRYDAVCFASDNKAYLIGGINLNSVITDTICAYNIGTNTWESHGKFPVPIKNGIALTNGEKAYVGLGDKGLNESDFGLWTSSDDFTSWVKLAKPEGRMSNVSSGVIYNNSIYVIDDFDTIWQYAIDEDKWYQRSSCSLGTKNNKLYVLNDKIYVLGMNYLTKKLMTYDPSWDN
nr:kelch repeat-containing protein [Parabacteroides goldsteinii]